METMQSCISIKSLRGESIHLAHIEQTVFTRTLSPVIVTCHFYEGDEEAFTTGIAAPDQLSPTSGRRFSSKCVASVKSSGGMETIVSTCSDTGEWCSDIKHIVCGLF